jgi:hypothetical protein
MSLYQIYNLIGFSTYDVPVNHECLKLLIHVIVLWYKLFFLKISVVVTNTLFSVGYFSTLWSDHLTNKLVYKYTILY